MITSTSSTSNFIKDFEIVIKKEGNDQEYKKIKSPSSDNQIEYCTINDTDSIYFVATLNNNNKIPCYLQIGDILINGTPKEQNLIEFQFRGNNTFFENFCGYVKLTLQIYIQNKLVKININ